MAAVQRHMPRRRAGHTTAVTIGGERFYLTANGREDGSLGEVFLQWGKQGTTGAGLMDIYAVDERVAAAQPWLEREDARLPAVPRTTVYLDAFLPGMASRAGGRVAAGR
jgi:hypothetical protein